MRLEKFVTIIPIICQKNPVKESEEITIISS